MLITQIKPKEEILKKLDPIRDRRSYGAGKKVLIFQCIGCREVHFPQRDVENFIEEISKDYTIIQNISVDYLCNEEFTKVRIKKYKKMINSVETILLFSCGVGMQVFSSLVDKQIISGLDTIHIGGFQGLKPTNYGCEQCGDCILGLTGGICPITACSKSLLNGPCGGAKEGKCEVDPEKECGWEKIYERLKKIGRLENLKKFHKPRDYSKMLSFGPEKRSPQKFN